MAHPKRRTFQHIMEDESWDLVGRVLPKEWVRHEYTPDYGIDFVVEIFKWVDAARRKADTLGDLFFVQLKSVEKTEFQTVTVHERGNVAKIHDAAESRPRDSLDIEVIPFTIETDELLTIESMGSAIPVLLFLVTLDSKKVYFVCLNDLIEKVIIPADPDYTAKGTKTIHVPVKNEVSAAPISLVPLRFYAKRSKLYAAFAKFAYQQHELSWQLSAYEAAKENADPAVEDAAFKETLRLVKHFLTSASRLTIWEDSEMWRPIVDMHAHVKQILATLERPAPPGEEFMPNVVQTFRMMANLSNVFEELCREWFMPTFLAQLTSYPQPNADAEVPG